MSGGSVSNDDAKGAKLVQLLTSHQRDIYLYVRSLLLDTHAVEEVVQNTNLLLWEKRDQFDASRDFRPWAFQIARYKVSEYRAQSKRKCACFSEALVDELALKAPRYAEVTTDLVDDLRRCIAKLPLRDRELLNHRYSSSASCERIATSIGRPIGWVYKALNRIRQTLVGCMARHQGSRREQ